VPGADVNLKGIDVFKDTDAFAKLIKEGRKPFEYMGFVILLDLGVTLTGFHDNDESQKALTAFARGRWDHLRDKFGEFHIS
jgi:hypothetical protein